MDFDKIYTSEVYINVSLHIGAM